jgi:hypothetical protein
MGAIWTVNTESKFENAPLRKIVEGQSRQAIGAQPIYERYPTSRFDCSTLELPPRSFIFGTPLDDLRGHFVEQLNDLAMGDQVGSPETTETLKHLLSNPSIARKLGLDTFSL